MKRPISSGLGGFAESLCTWGMGYPRKTFKPSNTVRIHLDPRTFDALKAVSIAKRDTMERVAHTMLAELLGVYDPIPQRSDEPE